MSQYICNICNKKYKDNNLYLKHINKRHSPVDDLNHQILKCNLCKYVEPGLQTTQLFNTIKNIINDELVGKINAVFQFNILKNDKICAVWTVNMKCISGIVHPGPSTDPTDCIIKISDEDLHKMAIGELNHIVAFITGKLKVDGNILIAPRLQYILDKVIEIENKKILFTCECIKIDSIDKVIEKYSNSV